MRQGQAPDQLSGSLGMLGAIIGKQNIHLPLLNLGNHNNPPFMKYAENGRKELI